ncbi:MAG TPA: SprB repeat-containing protein [Chitinophagales bacterium]|nr:SprB repeat-containing protein [Chitinophagales bacterium]
MNNSSNSKKLITLLVMFFFLITKVFAEIEITFNVSNYAGGYNVSCNGATDGHIDATIVNAMPTVTFLWSNGGHHSKH